MVKTKNNKKIRYSKRKIRSKTKKKSLKGGAATLGWGSAAAAGVYLSNQFIDQLAHQHRKSNFKREDDKVKEKLSNFIFDNGCESKETERNVKNKWKLKFGDKPWTELYKDKPIILIFGHGTINDEVFTIPVDSQLISFVRSGGVGGSARRYHGNVIFGSAFEGNLRKDMFNTAMDPDNEDLYFLEQDGITRNKSFIYQRSNSLERFEKGSIDTSCQKLFREDDLVSNISINFYDWNGAFKYYESSPYSGLRRSPDPTHNYSMLSRFMRLNCNENDVKLNVSNGCKYITGIYIFNSPIPLNQYKENLRKKTSHKYLIDMLLNSSDIKELPSKGIREIDPDNTKFGIPKYIGSYNFKFNLYEGKTTLKDIMDTLGEGTYIHDTCKFKSKKERDEGTFKLIREISKNRSAYNIPPKFWEKHISKKTGKPYYWNPITDESIWAEDIEDDITQR